MTLQEYNKSCIKQFESAFLEAFGETPDENWKRSAREGKEFWDNLKEGDTLTFKVK